jgi:hypothetical protein
MLLPEPDPGIVCVTLDTVESYVRRGAKVIGREDSILEETIPAFNPPRLAAGEQCESDGA